MALSAASGQEADCSSDLIVSICAEFLMKAKQCWHDWGSGFDGYKTKKLVLCFEVWRMTKSW
jgi:hypothetical protein